MTATTAADAAWRQLRATACAPYRRAGRWAWHWARGKLGHDPMFRGLLERGELPPRARVLDIGCGQGLVASLLDAAGSVAAAGAWPADWPPAPAPRAYTGIELQTRDNRRARVALSPLPLAPRFVKADMRHAKLPRCDVVLMLDVLHYIDRDAQHELLVRARDALTPGGRLLLRVGDAENKRSYALSQWVDRLVSWARGQTAPADWGRPLAEWKMLLWTLGYTVREVPMSGGTPFDNVLLVADLRHPPKAAG